MSWFFKRLCCPWDHHRKFYIGDRVSLGGRLGTVIEKYPHRRTHRVLVKWDNPDLGTDNFYEDGTNWYIGDNIVHHTEIK